MTRFLAALLLALASVEAGASCPQMVFRLTASPLRKPQFFRESLRVLERHEGAFDEVWFGGGKPLCKIDVCRETLRRFAAFRPAIEKAGLRLSFQQGITLGHGSAYAGPSGSCTADEAEPFPDDAWMVRPNGEVAKGRCLCPRSPAVLDYEYRYVKAVLEELRPESYWLDDDLRLSVRREGCFCPRCIAAFNEQVKGSLTREELVRRLFEGEARDAIRADWIRFNEESLATYGRVVRKAADEVMPDCRLSVQTVSADCLWNGRSYEPLLRALSADGRVPAGIRPGHGYYREDRPLDMLEKALWCTREAERCRKLGRLCGTVCYEQETYPRRVMFKSPQAIVTECALALASGCDSLSLYWADGEQPERIEDFERFVKAVGAARPYFDRLSASTKRTALGGVARHLGSYACELKGGTLSDASDLDLMRAGIPVTVAESTAAHKVWRLTEKSLNAMDADEIARVRREGALEIVAEPMPLVSTRTKWLDEIDRLTGGRFPVRIDLPHAFRVLPRVDAEGKTDSVTILNLSVGDTDAFEVRIRNPRSRQAVLAGPRGERPASASFDEVGDELRVTIPNLGGWQIVTVFL